MKASIEDSTFDSEVLSALRRIIRAIDIHSRRLSKEFGLTGPQLLLLNEVVGEGRALLGTLAKKAHLSQATVTIIVDKLEGRGLVTRTCDTVDKRRVWVGLTEQGRKVLSGGPKLLQSTFLQNFNGLGREEQQSILSALQSVACMMDAQDLPVMPLLDVGPLKEPESPEGK